MNSVGCSAVLLSSMLACAVTQSIAATMTPYETVLLDAVQKSLLFVDMDTGNYTEIAIPVDGIAPSLITFDSSDAIYVYDGLYYTLEPPFSRSLMARLDPATSQWTTTVLDTDVFAPDDMEFLPDGKILVGGEFGYFDIDLTQMSARYSSIQPIGEYSADGNPVGIEVAPFGTIMFGALTAIGPSRSILFRQGPEGQLPDRFETGILLADFVLDREGSLIGVWHDGYGFGERALYRLDFDTKAVDLLFESDLLRGTEKIKLDPDGRIIALSRTSGTEARLVRVDLELETAELIAEFGGRGLLDLEIRIIPEPPTIVLLVLGLIGVILLRYSPKSSSSVSG